MKEIEIYIRKLILKLYLFFKKNGPKKDSLILTKEHKVLLVRLNKIGDALVTTHVIKYIKEYIGCEIHVLADRKNFFIFENDHNVDKTIIFSKDRKDISNLRSTINKSNYYAVFDLHDDVSTTVSMFIGSLKIQNKVGFDKITNKIFTHIVPYLDPKKHHIIERYSEILDYLNIPYDKDTIGVNYQLSEDIKQYSIDEIKRLFPNNKYLVGINISAGSEARFWGIENFKKLISYFSQYDVNILLFASPNDKGKAELIVGGKNNISAEPSFDKMTGMVSQLDFLFSPDTSVVHIASAFKIPVFGIYINYMTDNVIWYPYNTEYEVIVTEKPNFNELEFETVINKLKIFFEQNYNGKRNSEL